MANLNNPRLLVDAARRHTFRSLSIIVQIMEDPEVSMAIRLRAAEIVLERGYGKAPQAVLVGTESVGPEGVQAIPIIERIMALRAAKDRGPVVDLENSEARPIEDGGRPLNPQDAEAPTRAYPEDLI